MHEVDLEDVRYKEVINTKKVRSEAWPKEEALKNQAKS